MTVDPSQRTIAEHGRPALPKDASRLEMMRRVKNMSLEDRLRLLERLARDARWARSASRVR